MKTLFLFKEIYLEAFRKVDNLIIRNYLKVFSVFSFCMFLLAVYAIVFSISSGFAFD